MQWDTPEVDALEQVNAEQRLLFVANPTDHDQRVTLTFDAPRRLVPVWGGSAPAARAAHLALELSPYTIQIWEAQYD